MTKPRRSAAKKAAPRKIEELTPDEVSSLDTLGVRFEASELAWQRMTTAPDDADPWNQVEDHLLERNAVNAERRWKFFSK